jgi:hypothetical protein
MSVVADRASIDQYGSPDIAWNGLVEQLEAGQAQRLWLATVDPDGSPHLAGVPPWDVWTMVPTSAVSLGGGAMRWHFAKVVA